MLNRVSMQHFGRVFCDLDKRVDMKRLRIVYMGTPEFAVAPLEALVKEDFDVVAVVTTPDKPSGRGLKAHESAVKQYAQSIGLPVLQPEKLKDEAFLEALRSFEPDLGIVVAFRMLPEVVWAMPRLGTFNLHAALLPAYRGAAPINWAIINGEMRTGVTTFFLNAGMDTGEIIAEREVDILSWDNAGSLHDKLMKVGAELVVDTVYCIKDGTVVGGQQPEIDNLPVAPKLTRENTKIDFTKTGTEIVNLVRGLSPYPAAWTELKRGDEVVPIKVFSATTTRTKDALVMACSDGEVYITELQIAGKRRMSAAEFLRGWK